jgi:hypothetical protein
MCHHSGESHGSSSFRRKPRVVVIPAKAMCRRHSGESRNPETEAGRSVSLGPGVRRDGGVPSRPSRRPCIHVIAARPCIHVVAAKPCIRVVAAKPCVFVIAVKGHVSFSFRCKSCLVVIPAKAGIQRPRQASLFRWVPAFAGTTAYRVVRNAGHAYTSLLRSHAYTSLLRSHAYTSLLRSHAYTSLLRKACEDTSISGTVKWN